MIVIYPMLTSGSVSSNVLPGITKAMEKYILLYNTDEVLRVAGGSSAGQIMADGAKLAAAVIPLVAGEDNTKNPGSVISEAETLKPANVKPVERPVLKAIAQTIQHQDKQQPSKASLDLPRSDAISLEPTWVTVTTKKKGTQILGVKVIPFRVKSGESMASMLTQDSEMKNLSYLASKYGRAITRVFYRILRKVRIPIIKDRALSGDPQTDILYGETQYGQHMFMCLSRLDLETENIFSTPAGIQKLHKLGWASFSVVDDVNRTATFCMKEFGGVCSVVPYGFIFSSLGKEHSKVYEDLEDLKKSSGPFFSMKTTRKNVFSESNRHIDKYLELIQKENK